MKTLSEQLLQEIERRPVAELQPEHIVLFGSHACVGADGRQVRDAIR
jgi:predicted nucleotidyltransferase